MTDATVDSRLVLAYDAAREALKVQDGTLSNIRTRANNVLAAAALLTSFSAGIGLVNTDPNKGQVLSPAGVGVLLACVIVIGISALAVLWPAKGWHFGPSPNAILNERRKGQDENQVRETIVESMLVGIQENAGALAKKQKAFRLAAATLLIEVSALLGLLISST